MNHIKKRAFTLVELIVVITVLAILFLLAKLNIEFAINIIGFLYQFDEINSLLIIIPVLLGTWSFNNAKKFKK